MWRPIDSAPRDGTWVLVTGGRPDFWAGSTAPASVAAQWTGKSWVFAWYDDGCSGEYLAPTRWMPLPVLFAAKP